MSKILTYLKKAVGKLANRIAINFKLLTYDIETAHLKARIWRPGEQRVNHEQMLPNARKFRILTITYKWWHENTVHTLTCGENGEGQKEMIAKFDAEIKKAKVVFGKNNNNFDDKHINTIRLLEGGEPMPEWAYKCDDLEKQIRKYFTFPSFSLDYISSILELGGKVKMERRDWIDIEDLIELNQVKQFLLPTKAARDGFCQLYFHKSYKETIELGRIAFAKMIFYNQKDVTDTETILNKIMPHVQLRNNAATGLNQWAQPFSSPNSCVTCGSNNVSLVKNKDGKYHIRTQGTTMRAEFYCNNHKGYAGSRACSRTLNRKLKFTGKMTK